MFVFLCFLFIFYAYLSAFCGLNNQQLQEDLEIIAIYLVQNLTFQCRGSDDGSNRFIRNGERSFLAIGLCIVRTRNTEYRIFNFIWGIEMRISVIEI
jgi:hypothetical protein